MIKFRFLFCVLPVMLLAGCGGEIAVEETDSVIPVEVHEVRRGVLTETIPFVGDVRGKKQVQVYPRVGGKLTGYKVREGDTVNAGDTIALIDRDITGYEFAPAPVESPIAGVVARIFLDAGDALSPQSPVAVIAEIEEVVVRIEAAEVDYSRIKTGQAAMVRADAYPGEEFAGRVTRLSSLIDPMTRTATAEITVPNPGRRLIPGMFARIDLVVGEREGLFTLNDGVIRRAGTASHYCMVVEDGVVKRVRVEPGLWSGNYREIISGLKEGDLVIISAHGILETGTRVEIAAMMEE